MQGIVFYFSKSGNTELVAKAISEKMDIPMVKLGVDKDKKMTFDGKTEKFDVSAYDTIFLGSPVRAGSLCKVMKTFLLSYSDSFTGKKVGAFFTYSISKGSIEKKLANHIEGVKNISFLELKKPGKSPEDSKKKATDWATSL